VRILTPTSWVGVGLVLLIGCQTDTKRKVEEQVATVAAVPVPTTPFVGYHRYLGTVGGRAVTLEIIITPAVEKEPAKCEGHYYYSQGSGGQLFVSYTGAYQAQQPLRLTESADNLKSKVTGHWQAVQPAGPLLTGMWSSPSGKQLPFSLHEDYTDGQGHVAAVQYELLQEGVEVPCQSELEEGESKAAYRARTKGLTSSYSQFFLHLLGSDTLRPALRALQCPVPARRQGQMRKEVGYAGCNQMVHELEVSYNAHGLLSLASFYNEDNEGAVHPAHGVSTITYDLRTGRALAIAALIRPGTDSILSRLITQHLEQDEDVVYDELLNHFATDSTLAPLPQQGLGIADEGLEFTYTTYEILPYVHPPVTLLVPWRELLPLLSPDSPVARMLRERGLWKQQKLR
jgi:hypothetical protein